MSPDLSGTFNAGSSTLISGSGALDFSGGTATFFGFTVYNNTTYPGIEFGYDNWSLTSANLPAAPAAVPEPAPMVRLGAGLAAVAVRRQFGKRAWQPVVQVAPKHVTSEMSGASIGHGDGTTSSASETRAVVERPWDSAIRAWLIWSFSLRVRSRRRPRCVFGWTKELLHPVFDVAWAEAQGFCAWVGGRLPTEAEWEYAARGGVQGEIYPFNFDNAREKANFYGLKGNDRYAHTAPVRTFDPNGFRLFDIAGNVWEWTADWSDPTYYQQSPEQDPTGPSSRTERVARGGSFFSDPAKHLRISYREKFPPKGVDGVGFRCVLEDSPDTRMRFAR